jgi:FkbM family methyltransferase
LLIPEHYVHTFKKFKSDCDTIGLYDNYRKLIHSLDDESIETVNRVISNVMAIERVLSLGKNSIDIFTKTEKKEIEELSNEFWARLIQISAECYVYKKFFLPKKWFAVGVFYHQYCINKLKTLGSIRNKNIIDAGAFIGDSALVFALYTDKKVYAFEPLNSSFNMMLKTIQLNDCSDSVVPVNLALGRDNGIKSIFFPSKNPSSSSAGFYKDFYDTSEKVRVITLDSYVEEHNLDVGLIKTDLEGFEQDFLAGAELTIRKQKPVLLISIYHSADDFFLIKPMIESWDLGYTFSIKRPTDGFVLLETLLVAEVLP